MLIKHESIAIMLQYIFLTQRKRKSMILLVCEYRLYNFEFEL